MKLRKLIAGGVVLPILLSNAAYADEIGYARCDEEYINIRAEASTESDVLGKIYNNGQVIIEETLDGWYKIKSGNVEGYICADFLAVGEDARSIAEEAAYNTAYVYPEVLIVRAEASEDSNEIDRVYEGQEVEVVETEGDWAKVCLAPDSYGYISAYYIDYNTYYGTAETLEEEQERLDQQWLDYLASQVTYEYDEDPYEENAEYYYSEEAYNDYFESQWISEEEEVNDYSEIDNNYYYDVPSANNYTENNSTSTNTNDTSTYDEETNDASYTSTSSSGGQYLSDYAKQYIGNPYVWGGTSLKTGADCSGFTYAVLAANGITVNGRTAAEQAQGGTQISLADAQAGDLIYYNNGSGVYHIAIYNGDGTVTHSSSSTTGVTVSNINYSGNAAGAVRYW